MGENSWRPTVTMNDWMRDIEKRLMHEERRPSVAPAYDIVGPGISTYSIQVNDWNSPGPIVNGFFYSVASQVVNSPDDTMNWMGIVQANPIGQGLQRVWEYVVDDAGLARAPSPDPALFTRSFVTNDDGTRTYTDWMQGSGGVNTPTGPAGGDLTGTYPDPTISPEAASALMVDVYDEGAPQVLDASIIDFVGSGVTVSSAETGHAVVAIASGSGGGATTTPMVHGEWFTIGGQFIANTTWEPRFGWTTLDATHPPAGCSYDGNGVFTVAQDGWYLITFLLTPVAGAPGRRVARLLWADGSFNQVEPPNASSGTDNVSRAGIAGSFTKWLPAGGTVSPQYFHSTGGNLAWDTIKGENMFSIASLANQGAVGPVGPQGPPGAGIARATFTFAAASTSWSLPHNLGESRVNIYATDNAHKETVGDITHVDANNAQITWTVPMTGYAEVSI